MWCFENDISLGRLNPAHSNLWLLMGFVTEEVCFVTCSRKAHWKTQLTTGNLNRTELGVLRIVPQVHYTFKLDCHADNLCHFRASVYREIDDGIHYFENGGGASIGEKCVRNPEFISPSVVQNRDAVTHLVWRDYETRIMPLLVKLQIQRYRLCTEPQWIKMDGSKIINLSWDLYNSFLALNDLLF